MMRHSFQQYGPGQSPSLAPSELPTPAGGAAWTGCGCLGCGCNARRSSPCLPAAAWPACARHAARHAAKGTPFNHFLNTTRLPACRRTGTSPLGGSPIGGSPLGGSPTASRLSSRAATPTPGRTSHLSPSQLHQSLVNRLGSAAGASATGSSGSGGPRAPPPQQAAAAVEARKVPAGASPTSASPLGTSPEASWSLAAPHGRSPVRRTSSTGPAIEAAEAALAALSSPPASSGSSGGTQPITIGSRLASTGRPPLPLLSPVRGGGAAGGEAATANGTADGAALPNGSAAGGPKLGASPSTSPPAAPSAVSAPTGTSPPSPFHTWWPGLRVRTSASGPDPAAGAGPAATAGSETRRSSPEAALGGGMRRSDTFASVASLEGGAGGAGGGLQPSGWCLSDPEHLVVCGSGGGFCHPTHVFRCGAWVAGEGQGVGGAHVSWSGQ